MSATATDDPLVRYLLGQADEDERAQVEERLFTDDAFEEELMATADELMHDYLAGRLKGAERLFFEERFLAVRRHRERLSFLHGLRTVLPPPPPARPRWLGPAMAAGVAAAALGAWWLSTQPVVAPGHQSPAAVVERPVPATPGYAAAAPSAGPSASAPGSAPLAKAPPRPLAPGTNAESGSAPPPVRDAAVHAVRLPATPTTAQVALGEDTERVRVTVDVAPEPPSFDAVLRTEDGLEVWRAAGLSPPAGEPLVVEIPAHLLQTARYALLVEGERVRGGAAPSTVLYQLEIVRGR